MNEPENYEEYGVIRELPPKQDSDNDGRCDVRNVDGSCSILLLGDNHSGYLGYRDFISAITNNGALDRVATDWKAQQ